MIDFGIYPGSQYTSEQCSPLEQSVERLLQDDSRREARVFTISCHFNLFMERIMHETFQDYHTAITIGGRPH